VKTVGEVLKLSLSHVSQKGGRPRHEVEWFVASVLGTSRLNMYLLFDRPLEESELSKIRSGISRLSRGEPLAYIQEKAPFYKDEFVVSKNSLIPRPETEILVDQVSSFLSSQKTPGVLFDICTGSGCIGLSLKKLFPEWHIVLSDISQEALFLAQKNAYLLQREVECVCGDLFKPLQGRKAHCIVANPPYLSQEEWESLDESVKSHEPKLALVSGKSGLEWYQRFFAEVRSFLHERGSFFLEIGSSQGDVVTALAKEAGYSQVAITKDLGLRDRVLSGVF
jgi:release factor glutamine methyltransferase